MFSDFCLQTAAQGVLAKQGFSMVAQQKHMICQTVL